MADQMTWTVSARRYPQSARYLADTVNLGLVSGSTSFGSAEARQMACHIPHDTANNNVEMEGGGGLMLVIEVES